MRLALGAQEVRAPGAVAVHTSDVPSVPSARRTSDQDRPQPVTDEIDWVCPSGPSAATSRTRVEAADVETGAAGMAEAGLVTVRELLARTLGVGAEAVDDASFTLLCAGAATAASSGAVAALPTPTTASAAAAATCAAARADRPVNLVLGVRTVRRCTAWETL